MRITGLILIILGSLMIVLNFFAYTGTNGKIPYNTNSVNTTAYYIGYNLFFIVGSLVFILGYWLFRKAKRRKHKKELLDNFLNDYSSK